ncbi:unnamed protein product, partial [Heligmosomoides polygyrus]|uniref:C2H2-type domain-containing protein n=1 Tax=Heligmosomoides polygyrus TaxID=6339 RepID=A0A183GNB4_HELPZ
EEVALYEQHLPTLPPQIPDPVQRLYVVRVDSVEPVQNAGAGFRLMTSCVTDDMMVSLFHVTTDRYYVNNNAEDVLQLAQVLRHVWNMLPLKKRLAWENAARELLMKAAKASAQVASVDSTTGGNAPVDSTTGISAPADSATGGSAVEDGATTDVAADSTSVDSASAENGSAEIDKENKEDKGTEETVKPLRDEAMPIRDFPFGVTPPSPPKATDTSCQLQPAHAPPPVDHARKTRAIESSCCSIRDKWTSFGDVQSHIIAAHYTAIFYGCHFCGALYPTVEALLAHSECTRWTNMLLSQMVQDGGKQMRKVEMRAAYLFIVCSDCGLWLPIRVNYPADRLPKAWCFFATVMENHSCKKLVPMIIYMAQLMDVPSRDARVLIQFLPSFLKNIPYSCEECSIDSFATPDEMDLHFQKVHHIRYKCTKCGECSGTELYHKAHLSTHLSDSLLLADYLRTTCTFQPPPHCSAAPPVVGFQRRSAACGGSTTSHTPALLEHDLLDHCEELLELKIWNSMENAKLAGESSEEETDDDEDIDTAKHRSDAAYENYDYTSLWGTIEDKEAKTHVNNYFHKVNGTSEPEEAVLDWRTRVNNPSETVKLLERESTVDLSALAISHAGDKFADMLVSKFLKRISLPISACMELLSGNLFLKRSICLCGLDISLQDLASRYPDTRSAVARDTDNALWLRYGVLQPKTQFDMQLKLARKGIRVASLDNKITSASPSTPRNIQPRTTGQVRRTAFPTLENMSPKPAMEAKEEQSPLPIHSTQGLNQHYIKPFVLVNNMLRCKFCAHQTSTPQAMRDHLQANHVLVCRACGNGFAHREALTRHGKMGRCSLSFKDSSVKHISADCGVCKKRMSLANAYLHLFREHLSSVVYGTVSGQVYPEHQNLHVDQSLGENMASKESVAYSPTVDLKPIERNTRDVVVYRRPNTVVCCCYLCGMEMASLEQLNRHLNRHAERWTRCPFCLDYVPIANHEVMKAHLMQKHMEKRDGCLSCKYCQRSLVRGAYAHLLYMCTLTRKCALCRGEQGVKNAAEMTVHWTNRHLDIMRRYVEVSALLDHLTVAGGVHAFIHWT